MSVAPAMRVDQTVIHVRYYKTLNVKHLLIGGADTGRLQWVPHLVRRSACDDGDGS